MNNEKIIKGLFAIKHLCKNQSSCDGCKYYDSDNYKNTFCKFKTYPADWDVGEIYDVLETAIKEVKKWNG